MTDPETAKGIANEAAALGLQDVGWLGTARVHVGSAFVFIGYLVIPGNVLESMYDKLGEAVDDE